MASVPPQAISEEIKSQLSGLYKFVGPDSAVSPQYPIDPWTPGAGTVNFYADGGVTLEVNFYRNARGSSFYKPGTVASLKPDGQLRAETYKVSSSGFFGGSSTEERQIEITDTQKFDESTKTLHLTSQTVMSSRPYTWFNKQPWKRYKTVTVTWQITPKSMTFHEKTEELLGNEETTLKFQRD